VHRRNHQENRQRAVSEGCESDGGGDAGSRWTSSPAPPVRDVAAALTEECLVVVELSVATRLELGRHQELIPDLRGLCRDHPGHEGFYGQLMIALQLPLGIADFVGRDELLGEATTALTPSTASVPVVTITGPPGIGKTAIAIRLARAVAGHYPDGQWYVELGRGTKARDRIIVLGELLRTSGADPAASPPTRASSRPCSAPTWSSSHTWSSVRTATS
jgi:hypothetical protein